MTPSSEVRRVQRQRAAYAVHGLGPRALFELVDELVRHHPKIADDLDRRLAAYAEHLSPELLRAVGGNCFPAVPFHSATPWRLTGHALPWFRPG